MKKALLILTIVLGTAIRAQVWAPLDTGIHTGFFPSELLADTANNNLITFNQNGTVWRNQHWEKWYPNIIAGTYSSAVPYYGGKNLFFAIYYENNDISMPRTKLLRFSTATDMDSLTTLEGQWFLGNKWDYYQGNLILPTTIQGGTFQPNGITSFNGTSFTALGDPAWQDPNSYINQVCVYKGELYAAGFIGSGDYMHGLVKLTSSGWQTVGNGILGGNQSISQLLVYNNRLYVIGGFWKRENGTNPGNSIAAWDRQSWDSLQGGVSNEFNYINGAISDAVVCHGKLYVVGQFTHAGNIPSLGIAVWNDTTWCTLGNDLASTGGINNIECLQDTVYAAGSFDGLYGQNYGYIMKLRQMNYAANCAVPTGIDEIPNSTIKIYPNPATSVLNISDDQNDLKGATISIINSVGQTVLKIPFSNSIDISSLTEGYYLMNITTSRGLIFHSKFIKE